MRKSRQQAGSALIEALITIPFLLTLVGGTLDLGRLLVQYMRVVQVASEGAKLAARQEALESGEVFTNLVNGTHCFGEAPERGCQQHLQTQQRIATLLNVSELNLTNLIISSSYSPTFGSGPAPERDSVLVSISARYDGLLPFIRGVNINVARRAQYLF